MSPKSLEIAIRPATVEDVPTILTFIRRLAEYERLSHEVVATEADLHQTLFGNKPSAEVAIGEWAGKPVGFAIFFQNYSTFLARPGIYLEDLFVDPTYRGKGLGKALFTYVAKLTVERELGRFDWAVLDWNEPSIQFYESMGAKPLSDWIVYRLTGKPLMDLASTEAHCHTQI